MKKEIILVNKVPSPDEETKILFKKESKKEGRNMRQQALYLILEWLKKQK